VALIAPIRTSEHGQLVAEGKNLEQGVATRRFGWSDRSARPDDVSHRPLTVIAAFANEGR
jgi:hypothetical protein